MKKRVFSFIFAVLFALAAAGCRSQGSPDPDKNNSSNFSSALSQKTKESDVAPSETTSDQAASEEKDNVAVSSATSSDQTVDNSKNTSSNSSAPVHVHSFGEWQTEIAATCSSPGREKRTCTLCGNTEYQNTANTGHFYNANNGLCIYCGMFNDDITSVHVREPLPKKCRSVNTATGSRTENVWVTEFNNYGLTKNNDGTVNLKILVSGMIIDSSDISFNVQILHMGNFTEYNTTARFDSGNGSSAMTYVYFNNVLPGQYRMYFYDHEY